MYLLIIILLAVLVLNIFIKRSSKSNKPFEDFLEKQRLANTAPKKEIPDELYVTVNAQNLPVADALPQEPNEKLLKAQNTALKLIGSKMLKLPNGTDNSDIKIAYGAGNFERVVSMEGNYENCMHALINWAEELVKAERYAEAERVLREAITAKTDMSRAFALLRDCYIKQNNGDGAASLRNLVNAEEFLSDNPAARKKIRGLCS